MKRKAFLNALKTKLENISDAFIGFLIVLLIVFCVVIGAVVGVRLNPPLMNLQIEQYEYIAESIYYNGIANTEIPEEVSVSVSNNFTVKISNDDQSVSVDFSNGEPNILSISNGKVTAGFLGAATGLLVAVLILLLITAILAIIRKFKIFFSDLKFKYQIELKQLEKQQKENEDKT